MRFFGFLGLAFALYFSWGLFNGKGALVPEVVQIELRRGLSEQLTQYIVEARPEAYHIEVLNFWTEAISASEVSAHFTFEFKEPDQNGDPVRIEKKASARIQKQFSKNANTQIWRAQNLNLEGQIIEFTKGLEVLEDN